MSVFWRFTRCSLIHRLGCNGCKAAHVGCNRFCATEFIVTRRWWHYQQNTYYPSKVYLQAWFLCIRPQSFDSESIGVTRGDRGPCPPKFLGYSYCGLRGSIPNKIGVIRLKSNILAPPNFLGCLRCWARAIPHLIE